MGSGGNQSTVVFGTRILIVDDDKLGREWVRIALEDGGYGNVIVARNGEEAMALLSVGDPFDVVITDQRIGVIGGDEILDHVRTACPTTGRIMVSGFPEHEQRLRAAGLLDAFLQKPAPPRAILDAVAHAIGRRR